MTTGHLRSVGLFLSGSQWRNTRIGLCRGRHPAPGRLIRLSKTTSPAVDAVGLRSVGVLPGRIRKASFSGSRHDIRCHGAISCPALRLGRRQAVDNQVLRWTVAKRIYLCPPMQHHPVEAGVTRCPADRHVASILAAYPLGAGLPWFLFSSWLALRGCRYPTFPEMPPRSLSLCPRLGES